MDDREDVNEGGFSGPSGLRQHAKDLERDNRAMKEELKAFRRREAFEKAQAESGVADLSLADVGDLAPELITAELLRAKGDELAQLRAEYEHALAGSWGFESAEDMRTATQLAWQQRQQEREALAAQAAAAGGTTPLPEDPKHRARREHEKVRQQGRPKDEAEAAYVGAIVEDAARRGGAS